MEMKKYKMAAAFGITLMGLGSFLACLATSTALITVGNVLLVISLIVLAFAFSKWQP